MAKYIYQNKNWTNFTWKDATINAIFGEVRHLQGKIAGQMNAIGFALKTEASLTTLTMDVVKSSAIEGELYNYEEVRSSIARRLGMDAAGTLPTNRNIEGVLDMMLDATQNYQQPLTEQRLLGWHAALFTSGYSGLYKIEVGCYRTGNMQIVSGAMGKEKLHYEAVDAKMVKTEMDKFLSWFNSPMYFEEGNGVRLDPVIKAAIAHFWFIIIHPFDDGNGRIARAMTDLLLSRAENSAERYYSMSSQILIERKKYYEVLQQVQHSNGDITDWLDWFLKCLKNALVETENTLQKVVQKATFWKLHEQLPLNARQRLIVNKLLDGFDGKLQSSKWAKIAKCSADTALRDIKDLIEKGILVKEQSGGRSTNYQLVKF